MTGAKMSDMDIDPIFSKSPSGGWKFRPREAAPGWQIKQPFAREMGQYVRKTRRQRRKGDKEN